MAKITITRLPNATAEYERGQFDQMMRLYDIRTWELVHSETFTMIPQSLHLTTDLRYLTVGGLYGDSGSEKCIVMNIK